MEIILVGIFAAIIGSFLNVCVYRIPRDLSVAKPVRSFCPSCNRTISWKENIPVISWTIQGGKCAGCKQRIPFHYPLVELLSVANGIYTYQSFGLNLSSLIIFLLIEALLVISFIDFEFKIIPDVISLPGITIGLAMGCIAEFYHPFSYPLTQGAWDSLLGMFFGGGSLYAIAYFYYLYSKQEGLGGGDIKLLGWTGAMLGVSSVLPTILIGSILGSIVGVAVIIFMRGNRKSEIPFGPWLSLGAIIYIFAGTPITRYLFPY
jgi:leader peptidase (prepilin peptidase)/N-methyltransferase